MSILTFFMTTSYAEMRSEATKSKVWSLTSYKSLTFPSAIFGSPSREVDNRTVSVIGRVSKGVREQLRCMNDQ